MNKSPFKLKNITEKIKYLREKGHDILSLLKVDIDRLDNNNLDNIYDIVEAYLSFNSTLSTCVEQLEVASLRAPDMFKEDLNNTNLSEAVREESLDIFNQTVIAATNNFTSNIKNHFKKSHDGFFKGLEALEIVKILESIIEFRKKIDKKFPGLSETIIGAATNSLISIISIYSPPLGLILSSLGLAQKINEFFKVENLTKAVEVLNNKFDEIKNDKQLAEIHKLGQKISELSSEVSLPATTIQQFGLDVTTIDKTITHVKKHDHAQKFIKVIGEVIQKLPPTKKALNEVLEGLENSIVKLAIQGDLKTETVEQFSKFFKIAVKDVEVIYSKCLEKGKTAFEKAIYSQEATNLMITAVEKIKTNFSKDSESKVLVEKFVKQSLNLVSNKMPSFSIELLNKAKNSPIIAKEMGLNIKVEIGLKKQTPNARSM